MRSRIRSILSRTYFVVIGHTQCYFPQVREARIPLGNCHLLTTHIVSKQPTRLACPNLLLQCPSQAILLLIALAQLRLLPLQPGASWQEQAMQLLDLLLLDLLLLEVLLILRKPRLQVLRKKKLRLGLDFTAPARSIEVEL